MIKKEITYTDYFGTQRTEEVRFHLSQAEIISLEASKNGGLLEWMKKCVATDNTEELMPILEKVILASYGEISLDGRRFVKSEESAKAFKETPMYSKLIESFFNDENALIEFFKGVGMEVEKVRTAPKLEDMANSIQ